MNNVNKGPLYPGVIARSDVQLNGVWRTWHTATYPGREERAFTTYDAAERYLIELKGEQ